MKRKYDENNNNNNNDDEDEDDRHRDEDIINSIMDMQNNYNEEIVVLKENEKTEKCEQLLFSDICIQLQMMEDKRIQKLQYFGRTIKKHELLETIINQKLIKAVTTADGRQSIYPLLRLLIPKSDCHRRNILGFKAMNDEFEDKKILNNWKNEQRKDSDAGKTIEGIISKRVGVVDTKSTLKDVNDLLDRLAECESKKKRTLLENEIYNKFSAMQQKWIIRIILGDLKLGLTDKEVIGRLHRKAYHKFTACFDLKQVCELDLTEEDGLQLGSCFMPMLAEGFSTSGDKQLEKVESCLAGHPFVMDVKLDGVRVITHIGCNKSDSDEVFMHTRNGVTDNHNYSILGKTIRQCVPNIECCIFDGEVCGWNNIENAHEAFDHNKAIARSDEEGYQQYGDDFRSHKNQWLQYNVFDIVYLSGKNAEYIIQNAIEVVKGLGFTSDFPRKTQTGNICYLPLAVRRQILSDILEEKKNVVSCVRCKVVNSLDTKERKRSLEEFFDEITLEGSEGLVVKNLDSPYMLDDRNATRWIKAKPDYGNGTKDIDLILLGAQRGKKGGFRGAGWSGWILGCIDDEKSTETDKHYCVVSKVGTGLNFEEIQQLRDKITEIGPIPFDPKNPPPHLKDWIVNNRPKPDSYPEVYFEPSKSIVIQVKCAELTQSSQFSGGITTRFPRVERVRDDKPVTDAWTKSMVLDAYNNFRYITEQAKQNSKNNISKQGRRKLANKRIQLSKVDELHTFDSSKVKVVDKLFNRQPYSVKGKAFNYRGENYSDKDIQIMIAEHDGIIEITPTSTNTIIIAGEESDFSLGALMKMGIYDIISFHYIIDCISSKEYYDPVRGDYLHVCRETMNKQFKNEFDFLGNPLNDDTDYQKFSSVFNSMDTTLANQTSQDVNAQQIYKEYNKLKTMDWKELFDLVEDEEEALITCTKVPFWPKNVIIYLDIYENIDNDSVGNSKTTTGLINLKDDKLLTYDTPLLSLAVKLEYYGANLTNSISYDVSHIIINPDDRGRINGIQSRLAALDMLSDIPYALTSAWVSRCIEENTLCTPTENEKYYWISKRLS